MISVDRATLLQVADAFSTYGVCQLGSCGEKGALIYRTDAPSPREGEVAYYPDRHDAWEHCRLLNAQAALQACHELRERREAGR
jgi:hypothetical protein